MLLTNLRSKNISNLCIQRAVLSLEQYHDEFKYKIKVELFLDNEET